MTHLTRNEVLARSCDRDTRLHTTQAGAKGLVDTLADKLEAEEVETPRETLHQYEIKLRTKHSVKAY